MYACFGKSASSDKYPKQYFSLLKLSENYSRLSNLFPHYPSVTQAIGIFVVLPIMSQVLKMHDTLVLTICVATYGAGNKYLMLNARFCCTLEFLINMMHVYLF